MSPRSPRVIRVRIILAVEDSPEQLVKFYD